MAFAFLVETGTGLAPLANSYVSVSDADDILAMNIHTTANWAQLSNGDKERLLAWASRYLDERTRWFGYKAVDASPLRWPRVGIVDRDSIAIAATTIPHQLKVATAEMARYLIEEDRSVERDQDALKRLKADVIELEFVEGYKLSAVPAALQYLIAGLGTISSGNGVKFARIIR